MKKALAIFLAVCFILNMTTCAYSYGPMRKLGRGISNIVTCPFELPYRFTKATNEKEGGASYYMMYGLFEGIFMAALRGMVGTFETVTFLFPVPEGYKPMLDDPEFIWQWPSKKEAVKILRDIPKEKK